MNVRYTTVSYSCESYGIKEGTRFALRENENKFSNGKVKNSFISFPSGNNSRIVIVQRDNNEQTTHE